MSDIKKIIKANLQNLFEDFEDMEVAFGVEKDMSDEEKNQFGDYEPVDKESKGSVLKEPQGHPGVKAYKKTNKEAGKEATDYYKSVIEKMGTYQNLSTDDETQIGEDFTPVKRNIEDNESEMYYGSGMEGLGFDSEDTETQEEFDERIENLNGKNDATYKKIKKDGENYKKYKNEKPEEYHDTPKVRVTNEENMEKHIYTGVDNENVFKANGKLVSEEQVLQLSSKVPSRLKIDESVFAITDGDNSYKLRWDGDSETGEAVITNFKNVGEINENIDRMKSLWEFKSNDVISTKKNITENANDSFRKMYDQVRTEELGGDKKSLTEDEALNEFVGGSGQEILSTAEMIMAVTTSLGLPISAYVAANAEDIKQKIKGWFSKKGQKKQEEKIEKIPADKIKDFIVKKGKKR